MEQESTHEIYSQMNQVWPENNRWYDYTHNFILTFINKHLSPRLTKDSIYLNAGSGGSEYNLSGLCYHVDIAENLICKFEHFSVASIENMPFDSEMFDAAICVGSVLNYCDAVTSIREIARVIRSGGYLVLEFERSNTGELLFTSEYGKVSTMQQYDYMGHTHSLWLYSEKMIQHLLNECNLSIIVQERYHCISSLANRITHQEECSGKYAKYDKFVKPLSYFLAHNAIFLCKKS